MSVEHYILRKGLHVLLFFSFVGLALGQPVGHWISTTYGGWITLEAVAAYAVYLAGLIWLVNRVNKAAGFVAPSASPATGRAMSESEFIRMQSQAAERADLGQIEQPGEAENPRDPHR